MGKFTGTHWSKMPNADEIRRKIAQKNKGREAWNKGKTGTCKNPLKGKKLPKEWAEKCAEGRRNSGMYDGGAWNKGLTHKDHEGVLAGDKHYAWKGDSVGNKALHSWVKRRLGLPMTCACCGKKCKTRNQIHWANKSGGYKRDVKDWVRLCVSCHKRYDMHKLGKARLPLPCNIDCL